MTWVQQFVPINWNVPLPGGGHGPLEAAPMAPAGGGALSSSGGLNCKPRVCACVSASGFINSWLLSSPDRLPQIRARKE